MSIVSSGSTPQRRGSRKGISFVKLPGLKLRLPGKEVPF
jgi:hypothetical protein